MTILINNPAVSSYIFIAIFLIAILASIKRKDHQEFFSPQVSQELKGLAILMIIFGHIGYFLANDHSFLFPLSISAGVGVNLFLFLSGYGLATSALRQPISIKKFYQKRLPKLFIPLWLILALFLLLDYFILHQTYSWHYIVRSALGWFPSADISTDLNSPLWYFSLILFYYLLFPLIFSQNNYWFSAFIIYAVSYILLRYDSSHFINVIQLYKVHLLAFPLGVLVAGFYFRRNRFDKSIKKIKEFLHPQSKDKKIIYYIVSLVLLFIVGYTAYRSHVGDQPLKEQLTSLVTLLAILLIFLIKKINLKLFSLFGLYSYEIYLLHWPILYRYDLFYKYTPAWVATILYLILFLVIAWLLKKASALFIYKKN